MTAAYWSGQLAAALSSCVGMHRQRVRHLNRVAEGEETLTPAQRESLRASERRIAAYLDELHEGAAPRLRVVSMEEIGSTREQLPRPLREAYELLFCAAYGSEPAVSAGDPAVERGAGKRQTRTSSGQAEGRVPGAPAATKKFGQSQRHVIKSRAAYELKLRTDRRLRRVAQDIREELSGEADARTVNACSRCGRIGEDEWRFCPSCGFAMQKEDR